MASRLILIGGGARSGKSGFALAYAQKLAGPGSARPLFIATAQALDPEMQSRIDRHQRERGVGFDTLEEPLHLAAALEAAPADRVVLVDCLTLWLSNLLVQARPQPEIAGEIVALAAAARRRPGATLLVSNEVGMGVVPETPLGREFRDLAGLAHQHLAGVSDEIYAALMGLVVRLHPGPLLALRHGELPP